MCTGHSIQFHDSSALSMLCPFVDQMRKGAQQRLVYPTVGLLSALLFAGLLKEMLSSIESGMSVAVLPTANRRAIMKPVSWIENGGWRVCNGHQ